MEQHEPWEDHYYQTGSTNPPKSNNKLLTILLVAVILLGGLISLLSIMNVQLFKQVRQYEQASSRQPQFHPGAQEGTLPSMTAAERDGELTLELENTPAAPEHLPQAGISLQKIYAETIDSVVSIICKGKNSSSTGTGVVLDAKGYIVTNCHVVDGAKTVNVMLYDNRVLPAMVVGQDPVSDIAVLYVEASDLKPARFGDSSTLQVGRP